METKSKKLDNDKLEITVTLSTEEVQKEIDAAYKQAGKNRIPGFRPGKAPRKILENYFGGKEYFQAQATDELVRAFAPLATDELNIVPLSSPDFADFDLAEEGKPFTFAYSLEVAPELELSSYDPVKIELPSVEPTEEELQAQIDALLSYNITTDEEGNEQKPELTDAWVKETLEFENVDEFKERMADALRQQKSQDIPALREIRTSHELASRLVGDVPESLVLQTEQDNYRDLFQSLQQQHLTLDAYLEAYGYTSESFRETMHQQAHDSAAMSLALDALARHLELEASDEDVKAEFEQSGVKDPQKLYEDWKKNGRLSEIRQGLTRIKASQHLNDTAEIFEPGTLHPQEDEKKPAKKKTTKKASDDKEGETSAKKETKTAQKKPAKKKTDEKSDEAAEEAPKKAPKKKTTSKSGNTADTKKTTTSES